MQKKLEKGWIENVGIIDGFAETWQVIQDAAHYSFNASHSLSVAIDSIYGAYLKSHYPLEYYTTVLTLYADDMEVEAALLEIPYTNYPANAFESIGIDDKEPYVDFTVQAYITRVKQHKTKTQEQMAFLTFDTGDGEIELIAFANIYKQYKRFLKKNKIVNAVIRKTNKGIQLVSVEE